MGEPVHSSSEYEDYYDADKQEHLVRKNTPKKQMAAPAVAPGAPMKKKRVIAANFLKRKPATTPLERKRPRRVIVNSEGDCEIMSDDE